ncbi:MAG: Stealth CR1 domain-containing protein [Prevotella sp.]|nr:Stealth CR1 domain-containing protein [Prevotella sp.]
MGIKQIDFVVTWLDSSDPAWQKEYALYKNAKGDKGKGRYREMNIFHYWFRALEKYAPWVNKVYLVTNGKFPDWINKENPKLVLVKHEDYIPQKFLPTFNSCTIELLLHRIKGLSEHFVYFNDDIIINSPVTPDYYFKNELPCDYNKETCFNVPIYTPQEKFNIYMSMMADIGIVNAHFNRWETVCQSPKRWFGPHLGLKGLFMSSILMKQHLFVGFSNYHCEQTFLKSTFKEVWDKEPDFLNASCTRFREEVIANPYLFRYWQLAKNMFYPLKRKSYAIHISDRSCTSIMDKVLLCDKFISVCINDTSLCSDEDFEFSMNHATKLLDKKFPEKSSFEI